MKRRIGLGQHSEAAQGRREQWSHGQALVASSPSKNGRHSQHSCQTAGTWVRDWIVLPCGALIACTDGGGGWRLEVVVRYCFRFGQAAEAQGVVVKTGL
jgi:hypothetical protein